MSTLYEKSNRMSLERKKSNGLSNVKVIYDPQKSRFMARVKALIRISLRDNRRTTEETVNIDNSVVELYCKRSREVEKNLQRHEVKEVDVLNGKYYIIFRYSCGKSQ